MKQTDNIEYFEIQSIEYNLGRICLPRASQSAGTHRQSSERAESLDSRDFSKRDSVQLTL